MMDTGVTTMTLALIAGICFNCDRWELRLSNATRSAYSRDCPVFEYDGTTTTRHFQFIKDT